MLLRLYDYLPSGNGYKVRLLGRPFELVEMDIVKGETRTPDYLAKNANGRIPLLEMEDGTFLPESNAILFYLAEGTPFMPEDRLGRARMLQWMFFEQYSHEPNIAVVRFWMAHGGLTPEREAMLPACGLYQAYCTHGIVFPVSPAGGCVRAMLGHRQAHPTHRGGAGNATLRAALRAHRPRCAPLAMPGIAARPAPCRKTSQDRPMGAIYLIQTTKRAGGYAALGVMEGQLRGREWLVGDGITIADIALYAYTHVAHEGGFDLGDYPAVRAWLDRVAAQPGYVPITRR